MAPESPRAAGLVPAMRRILLLALPLIALSPIFWAAPARADERYFAYDPANDAARLMTRGITLQAERGLFGGTRVERLFATAGAGSAGLDRDEVPGGLRDVLPDGAEESNAYLIEQEGTGRALARVLCPNADQVWLVMGRVRPVRDLTIHAVGQTLSGSIVLCRTMEYRYRGEWARPEDQPQTPGAARVPPRG